MAYVVQADSVIPAGAPLPFEKDDAMLALRSSLPRSIPSLTGIRGVAALWVLAYHSMLVFSVPVTMMTIPFIHGWSGVDLFFVLSGFILMHAHGEDFRRITSASVRRFAGSRFLRVYPLNLAVLLSIVLLLNSETNFAAFRRVDNIYSSFLATASLTNIWAPERMTLNQPTWSLSAEILAYVAFPFLAWFLMRVQRSALVVAILAFSVMIVLRLALHQSFANRLDTSGAIVRLAGCFVGGAALWRLRSVLHEGWERFAAPVSILSLGAIVICSMSYRFVEALPVLYGILILSLSYQRGLVDRLLSSKVATWLGSISFALYLSHVTVLFLVQLSFPAHDQLTRSVIICSAIVSCVIVAFVFDCLVDQPIQSLKRFRRA